MLNQNLYLEKIAEIEALIAGKNFSAALFLCEKMIEGQIYFQIEELYLILSRINFSIKSYEKAFMYFSKVNDVTLKDNKYYFLKGQIFEKLKNFENAEHGYFVALRKAPKNRKYLKKYIEFVSKNNFYDSVIGKLEKLALTKPEKSFFLNLEIAKYYISRNNLKEAFSILKKINSVTDLENNLISEVYALVYESFGDYDTALKNLEKIIYPDVFQSIKKDEISFHCNGNRSNNVENFYNFDFVKKNKILTIVFSSLENKFILRGYNFNTSVLFISEKLMTYYTYQYENLIEYLVDIINENNIHKINLVGSSKGSFAAINVAINLEKKLEKQNMRVVAFSPQSYIFPLNENIKGLPSYKNLLSLSKQYTLMRDDLSRFGNPIERMIDSNVEIKIIYGGSHKRDEKEAKNFKDFSNVELLPISDYPFHTSMLIYTKKDEKLKLALTRKIDSRSKDDDSFFRPEDNEKLIKEIINKIDFYKFELNEILLK